MMNVLFKLKVQDMTSGYRVYNAACLRKIQFQNDNFAFLPEILIEAARLGAVIEERPIHFIFRKAGQSKMAVWTTAKSYLRLFLNHCRPKVIGFPFVGFTVYTRE
jgi:dolichol-phosphate mannosyltransferase